LIHPEEQLRRDAPYQQQFIDRIERTIGGRVGSRELRVIFALSSIRPRLVILIDEIEDSISDIRGHARQAHQQLLADTAGHRGGLGGRGEVVGDTQGGQPTAALTHRGADSASGVHQAVDDDQGIEVDFGRLVLQPKSGAGVIALRIQIGGDDGKMTKLFRIGIRNDIDRLKESRIVPDPTRLLRACVERWINSVSS
jgi:hypothetical protein